MNYIIFQYKNIDISYFMLLIKQLLQTTIVKPSLNRMLISLKNIYLNILTLQNINYKNLYLLILNKFNNKNQYLILHGIINQLLDIKIRKLK